MLEPVDVFEGLVENGGDAFSGERWIKSAEFVIAENFTDFVQRSLAHAQPNVAVEQRLEGSMNSSRLGRGKCCPLKKDHYVIDGPLNHPRLPLTPRTRSTTRRPICMICCLVLPVLAKSA